MNLDEQFASNERMKDSNIHVKVQQKGKLFQLTHLIDELTRLKRLNKCG